MNLPVSFNHKELSKNFFKKLSSLVFVGSFLMMGCFVHAEKISAYFKASYQTVDDLKAALEAQKMEIWTTYDLVGKGAGNKVIIFTHPLLLELAATPTRSPAAVLRIFIDEKNKSILATNPDYFVTAFMQKQNQPEKVSQVTSDLKKILKDATMTGDELEKNKLPEYRFMMMMPYYHDLIEVAKGPSEELITRIEKNGSSSLLFKKKVGTATLMAAKLSESTEGFVDTIGQTDKAGLLPYLVFVEDGKAFILHPKYYLAISFPLLTMGQFMKISQVPGKIEDEFKKMFSNKP